MVALLLAALLSGTPDDPERWSADLAILRAGTGYSAAEAALRGSRGETVTVARASDRTCTEPDGAIRTVVNNKPCVSGGRLLMEPTATNVQLRSEELDNAAWVDFTSTTPIVTANSWDFGAGSATGETLEDDSASLIEGRMQTVATTTTGAWTYSCHVKAGTVDRVTLTVNVTGGSGSASCAFTGLPATTTRKTCTITAGAGVTAIVAGPRVGSTSSQVGTLFVGGCQLETGSVATSYIATAGTAVARAAESATVAVPSRMNVSEGCARVCITPSWTGSAPAAARFLTVSSSAFFGYTNASSSSFIAFDGTNAATIAAGFTAGTRKCYLTQWSASGNFFRVSNLTDGTVGTSVAFAGYSAFDANIALGSTVSATQQSNSYLDGMLFGSSATECN